MTFPRMTAGRLLRLCLKELRESLRDRRTIITLLLMPMMVYPLLSLVLHRVIPTETPIIVDSSVRIGISNQLRDSGIEAVILLGYGLLQNPSTTPIYIENPSEDRAAGTKNLSKKASAIPVPIPVPMPDNERQALRRNNVDLAIVRKISKTDDDEVAKMPPALEAMLDELLKQKDLPINVSVNAAQLARSLGRYEIAYRFGDPQSERALALVERSMAAVNAMTDGKTKRAEVDVPYSVYGTPVAMRHGHVDLLATMIPLVLVLMTMAGAVYPAIDLTAGERERGTMEALVVSPTSPVWILFSKYSAVVTVALLTALANLGAMSLTLWISGVGQLIFGNSVLTTATIGQVLVLLILFTMFFASLLLAVTSFAKSFKEAQAYLIPLMLLALTPGVTSLMAGIEFTPVLATVPLVNIVLLAREVLQGDSSWSTAVVTLVCNCVYAMASLTIASRLFGASAAVQGSQGSWRDWLTRAHRPSNYAAVDQMALLLATLFPVHFVCTSIMSRSSGSTPIQESMLGEAVVTWIVAVLLPFFITWYQRIGWTSAFRLNSIVWTNWRWAALSIPLLSIGVWVIQHEITAMVFQGGMSYVSQERMLNNALFEANFRDIPIWVNFLSNVVTPAICLELLFRGFAISSLHRLSAISAIVISSLLFSLFDMLASHVLSLDRFLPTLAVGLVLGWLSIRTSSIMPGIIIRLLVLGVPQVLDYFDKLIPAWEFMSNPRNRLPTSWNMIGLVCLVTGIVLLVLSTRREKQTNIAS
ncbi:MAG: ABC transporter permease subunit [Pirellulales bacterium]